MRRATSLLLLLPIVGVLYVLPMLATGYAVYIANVLLVYVTLCLGLHVLVGETGQFGMAHAAFYGMGIYCAGQLATIQGWPFPLSILCAGLLAGGIGLLVGLVALRMHEIYLALTTFAFGQAAQWLFTNWTPVTGGPNGLHIVPAAIGNLRLLSDQQAYPFVLSTTLLILAATVVISRSRLGRAFRAVRESPVAATAMGIPVRTTTVTAFGISAFYAGVAGGIFTLFSTFIHPESLGFQTTVTVLTMIVVGGLGSIPGAVAGAIIFGLVAELLRRTPAYPEIIYGVILMVFMMFLPKGLLSPLFGKLQRIVRPRPPTPALRQL